MKHRYLIAAVVSSCWLAATATPASAQTIYTDRTAFNAATTGQVVSDFNAILSSSGQSNPYPGNGWTLTSSNFLTSYNGNSIADYQFNSGTVLGLVGNAPTSATFTFAPTVTAFGFDYGVLARSAGAVVTINGNSYTAPGTPNLSFFGIVNAAGLSPISVSFAASRGIFDNVTVAAAAPVLDPVASAAPEPATWAMMIFGFGAVGVTLRRRRPATLRYT